MPASASAISPSGVGGDEARIHGLDVFERRHRGARRGSGGIEVLEGKTQELLDEV